MSVISRPKATKIIGQRKAFYLLRSCLDLKYSHHC